MLHVCRFSYLHEYYVTLYLGTQSFSSTRTLSLNAFHGLLYLKQLKDIVRLVLDNFFKNRQTLGIIYC